MSRLHRVVGLVERSSVDVEDLDGSRHRVSLLALEGPPPAVGDWLVVHAGYAIHRAEASEAESVAAELRRAARREALDGDEAFDETLHDGDVSGDRAGDRT